VLVTYTQPHESGASLKAAGFYIGKIDATKYGDGTIEGRVRWISIDGYQPDEKQRNFTKNGLENLRKLQLA
jgi:hypothetical protein